MKQREAKLEYRQDDRYSLRGLALEEGDSLDIRVGENWVSGYAHYEASDGNWYCDSGCMSIPLYDGREARFRLELVHQDRPVRDEDDLMRAALDELGEVYEEDEWNTEKFEDECEE